MGFFVVFFKLWPSPNRQYMEEAGSASMREHPLAEVLIERLITYLEEIK
jgi:hypothetical protein